MGHYSEMFGLDEELTDSDVVKILEDFRKGIEHEQFVTKSGRLVKLDVAAIKYFMEDLYDDPLCVTDEP